MLQQIAQPSTHRDEEEILTPDVKKSKIKKNKKNKMIKNSNH